MVKPTDILKRQSHSHLLIAVLLVTCTLLVYGQLYEHEFLSYDDDAYITDNPHIRSGWTKQGLGWAFRTIHHGHWHPLTWLSHMTDVQLFGLDPVAHHLINLLFHSATSLLLFWVFFRMTGEVWKSAFVAAIFSLHPLNVESVAWAAERKNVLSTFLWVATMWAYLRYARKPGILSYLLVLIIFALGLMSKLMLVTLPGILLLLDYWPLGRLQWGQSGTEARAQFRPSSAVRLFMEKLPLLALAIGLTLLTIYLRRKVFSAHLGGVHIREQGIGISPLAYMHYLIKMVWPSGLSISYPIRWPQPTWNFILAGFILSAVSLFGLKTLRKRPYILVGWLWFLLTLIPVIGLVSISPIAIVDRFMYVPMIGLLIAVSWWIPELFQGFSHKRAALGIGSGILVLIMMGLSYRQVGYWKSNVSLYDYTNEINPDNFLAHNNLGVILKGEGRLEEAISHFKAALERKPDSEDAHINLGSALDRLERHQEAMVHYEKALKINPKNPEAHNNLGIALISTGRGDEAVPHFEEALRFRPDYTEAHTNLGAALASKGEFERAVTHLRKALEVDPDNAEIHGNLGLAYLNMGKTEKALFHINASIRIKPTNPQLQYFLGLAFYRAGRWQEAADQFQNVVRQNPGFAKAHLTLGLAYLEMGDRESAFGVYRTLTRLNPKMARLLYSEIVKHLKRPNQAVPVKP
jgi:tetratricopeptide (TPR) repeat protein